RHLPGVDRLEAEPGWHREHRQPGQLPHGQQGQVVKLGGAQRSPGQAGVGDHLLGGPLGGEVAEHRPGDGADDRDPAGPHDRYVHQVPGPGPRRRPDQVPCLDLVAFAAAGEVHDDLGARHRGADPLAAAQVAGHELEPLRALATAPAEHPDRAAGVPQPRDDPAAERARTAGDQNAVVAPGGRFRAVVHAPVLLWWCAGELIAQVRLCGGVAVCPSRAYALTGCAAASAAFWRSSALAAPVRQLSAMAADMGSGKMSSSPLSTASKMARATDSGEALGMSKPRVISVSTGPVSTACTRTPRPASRARSDWVRLNAAALETE